MLRGVLGVDATELKQRMDKIIAAEEETVKTMKKLVVAISEHQKVMEKLLAKL